MTNSIQVSLNAEDETSKLLGKIFAHNGVYQELAENFLMLNRAKDEEVVDFLIRFIPKNSHLEAVETLQSFLLRLNQNYQLCFSKNLQANYEGKLRLGFLEMHSFVKDDPVYQQIVQAGFSRLNNKQIYAGFGEAQAIFWLLNKDKSELLQRLNERAQILSELIHFLDEQDNDIKSKVYKKTLTNIVGDKLSKEKKADLFKLTKIIDPADKELTFKQALEQELKVTQQTIKNIEQLDNALAASTELNDPNLSVSKENDQVQNLHALLDVLKPSQKMMLRTDGQLEIVDMSANSLGPKGISEETVAAANKILVAVESSMEAGVPDHLLLFKFIASEWGQNILKNNHKELQRVVQLQEEIQTFYTEVITKTNYDDFLKINDEEFLKPSDYSKEAICPNIVNSAKHFNQMSNYIASDILNNQNLEVITAKVSLWINVAYRCYQRGNFLGMQAVVSALNSTPVYRLLYASNDDTMQAGVVILGLDQAEQDKLKVLQTLINTDGSYKNLRQAMVEHTGAFIPPTIIQSDMEFTKRGNPTIPLHEAPAAKKVLDLIGKARMSLNTESLPKVNNSNFLSVLANHTETNDNLQAQFSRQVLPARESHTSLQPAKSLKKLVNFKAKPDNTILPEKVDSEIFNQIANPTLSQIFVDNNKHVSPEIVELINVQLAKPEELKYGKFYKFITENIAKSFILTESQFKAVKAEARLLVLKKDEITIERVSKDFISASQALKDVSKTLKPSYLKQILSSKILSPIVELFNFIRQKPVETESLLSQVDSVIESTTKLLQVKQNLKLPLQIQTVMSSHINDLEVIDAKVQNFINIHTDELTANKDAYKRNCLQLALYLKNLLHDMSNTLEKINKLNKKVDDFNADTVDKLVKIHDELAAKFDDLSKAMFKLEDTMLTVNSALGTGYKEFADLQKYVSQLEGFKTEAGSILKQAEAKLVVVKNKIGSLAVDGLSLADTASLNLNAHINMAALGSGMPKTYSEIVATIEPRAHEVKDVTKTSTKLIFEVPKEYGSLRYEYDTLTNQFSYYADADYQLPEALPTQKNQELLADILSIHFFKLSNKIPKIDCSANLEKSCSIALLAFPSMAGYVNGKVLDADYRGKLERLATFKYNEFVKQGVFDGSASLLPHHLDEFINKHDLDENKPRAGMVA